MIYDLSHRGGMREVGEVGVEPGEVFTENCGTDPDAPSAGERRM